jgi:hypothetical protein
MLLRAQNNRDRLETSEELLWQGGALVYIAACVSRAKQPLTE